MSLRLGCPLSRMSVRHDAECSLLRLQSAMTPSDPPWAAVYRRKVCRIASAHVGALQVASGRTWTLRHE